MQMPRHVEAMLYHWSYRAHSFCFIILWRLIKKIVAWKYRPRKAVSLAFKLAKTKCECDPFTCPSRPISFRKPPFLHRSYGVWAIYSWGRMCVRSFIRACVRACREMCDLCTTDKPFNLEAPIFAYIYFLSKSIFQDITFKIIL